MNTSNYAIYLIDPVMGVHHHTAQYIENISFWGDFDHVYPLFMVTYSQMDLFHRIFEMFCFSASSFSNKLCISVSEYPQVLKDLEKLKSLYFLIETGGICAKYMGTLWELKYSEILSYSSTEHFILSSLLWEAISIPTACRSFVRLQIPPCKYNLNILCFQTSKFISCM